MERLTRKSEKGDYTTMGFIYMNKDTDCYKAVQRLAEYENTELSPEEVENMKTENTNLKANWDILCNKFGEIIANDKDCESGCYSEALRIINEVKRYSGEYDELKHRAEVAEEALKLACQQLGYELHQFGVNKKIVVEPRIIEFKEQAEARLKELSKESNKED